MTDKENLEKKISIYEYLQQNNVGYLDELESVAGELFDKIKKENLIGYGLTAKARERYHVTERGKRIIKINLTALRLQLVELEYKQKN